MSLVDIDAEIEARKKSLRRGTMFADGVQWCPNCGSRTVTNGHVKCEDCDVDRGPTIEEFRKLAVENQKKSDENQAARGGRDWVDEVALEEALLREVDDDGDDEEEEEEEEEEDK